MSLTEVVHAYKIGIPGSQIPSLCGFLRSMYCSHIVILSSWSNWWPNSVQKYILDQTIPQCTGHTCDCRFQSPDHLTSGGQVSSYKSTSQIWSLTSQSFNPKTSRATILWLLMTVNLPGWKTKVIFHPTIFGQLPRPLCITSYSLHRWFPLVWNCI
jgi:hypothetical protein